MQLCNKAFNVYKISPKQELFCIDLIIVLDAIVYNNVEDDDDKDEDDVAHKPDVDLLEVARLGKVLLDGGQQTREHEQARQRSHESGTQKCIKSRGTEIPKLFLELTVLQ